jgi:PhzF family phenazine biosynthesis protein
MIRIKHVNAFTPQPFLGNPAAVVTKADGLTERQMQLIAREMNLSETAFVLRATRPAADLRLVGLLPLLRLIFVDMPPLPAFTPWPRRGDSA